MSGLDAERLAHALANETDSATEDERAVGDLWSLMSARLRAEWTRKAERVAAEYGPPRRARRVEEVARMTTDTLDLFGTEAEVEAVGRDDTPIETGGAIVIIRLTPAEVDKLRDLAPTLVEAIHITVAHVCEDES
jgi:hypothetical protein